MGLGVVDSHVDKWLFTNDITWQIDILVSLHVSVMCHYIIKDHIGWHPFIHDPLPYVAIFFWSLYGPKVSYEPREKTVPNDPQTLIATG